MLRVYFNSVLTTESSVSFYPEGHALAAYPGACRVAVGGVFITSDTQTIRAVAGVITSFTVTLFSETGVQLSIEGMGCRLHRGRPWRRPGDPVVGVIGCRLHFRRRAEQSLEEHDQGHRYEWY